MQKLAEVCVRRPVFATVLILTLVVVGAFSYFRLGVDRFPKVDFPIVTITVRQDGASPQELETDVVDKIEEAVNTVSGIDTLSSTSYEGLAVVAVSFQLEKPIDVAIQEVRDKVSGVIPQLPLDVKTPVVDKVDPDASPIMQIALSSPGNIRDTSEYADKVLRRQIESISGVGQVLLIGARKRQINVILDPQRLKAYNLTSADVQRALQSQNIQVPGGTIDQNTRELTLRTKGRLDSPAAFDGLVIKKQGPSPVRIRDVGRTEDGVEEPQTSAILSGAPTVLLSIRKQSGLNTVTTVDAIRDKINDIKKTLPSGYTIRIVRDQSEFIRASANAVKEHLVIGSILAALVVLIFLWNWRTTLISALAIPASIISTFAAMYMLGFTLNSLTLLGLTLSVGIVIDDAIVVLENIYRFIEEKGMNPFEAAIEGTREIGLAVLATTLSLIAVFLPVAFMSGIVGRFLNSFGMTMAFAIAVSLLVSFTLTPMLASRWIKMPKGKGETAETSDGIPVGEAPAMGNEPGKGGSSKDAGLFRLIDRVYTAMLRFSMRHRWIIVLACAVALYSIGPLGAIVPKNFLPEDDQGQFGITVRAPEGTSLATTQALAGRIAADTQKLAGVDYTVVTIGDSTQQTHNLASIFVKLKPTDQRTGISQQDLTVAVRNKVLPQYGSLRTSAGQIQEFSTGAPSATVIYFLSGPDLDKLTEYSTKILEQYRKIPGVVDADSSLIVGKPELGVNIDRQRAADLGVSVADISNTLRIMVGGEKVTDYYENGEQYEVHLRADLPYRNDAAVIQQMTVPSSTQGAVPVSLDQVVHLTTGTGPSQITRQNRRRNVLLTSNVLPGYSQAEAAASLGKVIADLHMPAGYVSGASGTSKELLKAGTAFLAAFLLAIIFMYLVLAAQFESWVHPITILIALPLTVPFALLAIVVFHQSVNIFTVLGMLVLFGVVKKNGILQVDHTNHLRAQGMNRYDAIIQANRDRLRPILMTTIAFVAGMIPLVLSNGTGSATNKCIGYTVIGGQTFSLLLTLLATPVFYSIFDDILVLFQKVRGRLFHH